TMRWWNGLWLNEAFATFMEMKCTDAFRPRWERWVDFGISRTAAFEVDSLESTRPIEFEVVSPKDSAGMFDILTYEKGAAVLRMLEQYLGEDAFRDGVRHYLTTHAYANTDTTDLWDSLEEATGQPVRRIMDGWIFRGGYPLICAALDSTVLNLSQRRFSYQQVDLSDRTWEVPVLLRYGSGGDELTRRVLLTGTEASFDLGLKPDWLVVNSGATGFFRVNYSASLLEALLGAGLERLSASERYALVDDRHAAMVAGAVTSTDLVDLIGLLSTETDLSVWQRMAASLATLDRIVDGPARSRYQERVRGIVGPALERLGLEPVAGESQRTSQLRGTLFESLGTVGADPAVRTRSREIHGKFVADPASVDPALAAASIAVIADSGDAGEFEEFWRLSRQASSPQLAVRYLFSLGRFPDPALARRLTTLATTEVRTQDAPFTLARALANRVTGRQVWGFLAENWDRLIERFPGNTIVRMVGPIGGINDREWAGQVESFFAGHEVPEGEKTLAQNLERMWTTVRLKEREGPRLAGDEQVAG
ncbi:MAG TPA: M1 family metallopeptidase, partial [Actinomycetota bacterium]|nr:M1 family metallopeptidase [Actinomycetota bacterium]